MGDEDDGGAGAREDVHEEVLHLGAGLGVERPEGFVHEDGARARGEGAGQLHALALPARELVRELVRVPVQADPLQPLPGDPPPGPPGGTGQIEHGGAAGPAGCPALLLGRAPRAPDGEREFDVGPDRAPGEQGVVLEDQCPVGVRPGDGAAVLLHRVGERRQQPREGAQERGLAAAGRAHDGEHLPGLDRQIDPVEHRVPAVPEPHRAQHEPGPSGRGGDRGGRDIGQAHGEVTSRVRGFARSARAWPGSAGSGAKPPPRAESGCRVSGCGASGRGASGAAPGRARGGPGRGKSRSPLAPAVPSGRGAWARPAPAPSRAGSHRVRRRPARSTAVEVSQPSAPMVTMPTKTPEHVGVLGQAEPPGDRGGGADGADGADLVGHPAVLVQGLGQALQAVQAVRVLLADHDGAHARAALHEPFAAQQVEGLADGVAAGAVGVGEFALQGEDPAGVAARQDLVAQQVGELASLVRAQAPPTRRRRPGRCAWRFVRLAWQGTYRRPGAGGVAAVLRHLMALPQGSELRFRRGGGKIRNPADRGVD